MEQHPLGAAGLAEKLLQSWFVPSRCPQSGFPLHCDHHPRCCSDCWEEQWGLCSPSLLGCILQFGLLLFVLLPDKVGQTLGEKLLKWLRKWGSAGHVSLVPLLPPAPHSRPSPAGRRAEDKWNSEEAAALQGSVCLARPGAAPQPGSEGKPKPSSSPWGVWLHPSAWQLLLTTSPGTGGSCCSPEPPP